MSNKNYPLPEAISKSPWVIRAESFQPSMNPLTSTLLIPLGNNEVERSIRAHEQGHIKWSPKQKPSTLAARHEIDVQIMMIVEDCRINFLCGSCGLLSPQLADAYYPLSILEEEVKRARSTRTTSAFATVFLKCMLRYSIVPTSMLMFIQDRFPRLFSTELRGYVSYYLLDPSRNKVFAKSTIPLTKILERFFKDEERREEMEKMRREELTSVLGTAIISSSTFEQSSTRSYVLKKEKIIPWGKMLIDKTPLSVRYRPELLGQHLHCFEEGSIFRYPHRYLIDRAVFQRKKKALGCSVLIDASGSMNWTPNDLETLVRLAPASITACYSGGVHGNYSIGKLRILCQNGKRVADRFVKAPGESGNVIDGPALQWLATQPAPRYWICDGFVSGINDESCQALTDKARDIVIKNRIIRFDNSLSFLSFLKKKIAFEASAK